MCKSQLYQTLVTTSFLANFCDQVNMCVNIYFKALQLWLIPFLLPTSIIKHTDGNAHIEHTDRNGHICNTHFRIIYEKNLSLRNRKIKTGDTFSEAVWSHVYFTRMQNGYRDGMAYYISAQRLVWFAAAHVGNVNGAALRTESAPAESSSSWPSLGVAMQGL